MNEDYQCELALGKSERKLRSLLELGRLIGLDLRLDEMLLRIAEKATETMEAKDFRVFLYDPGRDELWSTITLNMNHKELRFPADQGIAGYCFRNGLTVNITTSDEKNRFAGLAGPGEDVAGETLLSMPFYGRSGQALGVVQVMDKVEGLFADEDETFLQMFSNQVAVFIEMAQLQKARIDALEEARKEAEQLSRAKGKALDHLSHELRTPIALIQGTLRILQRRLKKMGCNDECDRFFENMEKYLGRLQRIQRESDKILRTYHDVEETVLVRRMGEFLGRLGKKCQLPADIEKGWSGVRKWIDEHQSEEVRELREIAVVPFLSERIRNAQAHMNNRKIGIRLTGEEHLSLFMDPMVLTDVVDGVVKNAVENTPDGGKIDVVICEENDMIQLTVGDSGVGIPEPDVAGIFDGLFHVDGTDMYRSRKPYDFGAGGKGLDLLLAKIYGKRYGFVISLKTDRCRYMEENNVPCPGDVKLCGFCATIDDCIASGGTEVRLSFSGGKRCMDTREGFRQGS